MGGRRLDTSNSRARPARTAIVCFTLLADVHCEVWHVSKSDKADFLNTHQLTHSCEWIYRHFAKAFPRDFNMVGDLKMSTNMEGMSKFRSDRKPLIHIVAYASKYSASFIIVDGIIWSTSLYLRRRLEGPAL